MPVLACLIGCNKPIKNGVYLIDDRILADTMNVGEQSKYTFFILNNTNKILIYDTIFLSCDCIELISVFDTIYPYAKDSLSVGFKAGREGHYSRGFSLLFENYEREVEGYIEVYVD